MIGEVPFFGDASAVFYGGLVVEDLVFDNMTTLFVFGHDASVGWYTVVVMF